MFKAFTAHGAYFVTAGEKERLLNVLFPEGKINRALVGQSVKKIAGAAGIDLPEGIRVIVAEATGAGHADRICKEKMFPVMGCLGYDNFEEALRIAKANLNMEGNGHTAGIHSNDQANVIKAGTELSVSRLIVNAPCATTAGGSIQNGLPVTNTLGCGSWGNNKHLLNITRIAPLSARIHVPSDEEIWAD